MQQLDQFITSVNDPNGRLKNFIEVLKPAIKRQGRYGLCIGSTATSDLSGISAAGADGEARRSTPAIDCEALVLGTPLTSDTIPVSPKGIVSPVVISRAMVNLIDCKIHVYDCGAFVPPKLEALRVGGGPAKCLQTGEALTLPVVEQLFNEGQKAGEELASAGSYVVIGECVPGGTTTALGVLTALGYPASKLVSSSMPAADHDLRRGLVQQGIANSGITPEAIKQQPLRAVAAVGDPMQPFAAGLALAASRHVPVVLGGGTQMLTVYALSRAIAGDAEMAKSNIAVLTTKWVAFDKGANAGHLAHLVEAPFAASCPDFHCSQHDGLKAYEEGNVKEGVAAGAMMAIAHLAGFSAQRICEAIDLQYDRMVLRRHR